VSGGRAPSGADPGRNPRPPAARKGYGQHFLSDPRILGRIVEGAGVRAGERVLEIGPGPGALTRTLLGAGAQVWAVEADPRMVEHLTAAALPGLHLLHADALQVDYLALAGHAGGPLRLVANLPYNISGPLLALLLRQRAAFVSLSLMLQREVADRLLAPAGGRTRGRLSVLAQCFCDLRPLLRVPPGAFRPPPKVDSAVVRLDPRGAPPAPLDDEEVLWRVVRQGFGQRRKMLRNTLRGACADPARLLHGAGLAGTERPEALRVEQWISLANALARGEGG
jgi:16S rRNA (adenine1518-N6/adenine1519-N6)-dimethyltransferase